MSYRQSNFDPNAGWGQPGRPLRPYNWVQWTGVGFVFLGVLGYLLYFADKFGWIDIGVHDAAPFVSLPLFGVVLINSRRAPGCEITPEIRRKRLLIIIIALAVLILAAIAGFAIAILKSKGVH